MFFIFRIHTLLSCLYVFINIQKYNYYLFLYCLSLFWRSVFIADWNTNITERFSYADNILFSKFSDRVIATIGEISLIFHYTLKFNKPELMFLISAAETVAWFSLLKFDSWYQYSIEYNLWSFIYFIISIDYFNINCFEKFLIYFSISTLIYMTNIVELYKYRKRLLKKKKESLKINFINSLKTNNISKSWKDWADNLNWMLPIFVGGSLIVVFVENLIY